MFHGHVYIVCNSLPPRLTAKDVRPVAIRRNPGFDVFNVRLLVGLDKLLREKRRYQGDLSASINDALLSVNLNTRQASHSSRQEETNRTRNPCASASAPHSFIT